MSLLPAMLTIQAIKTRYNGYKFLSRLEAHWAVFFDTLGIKYHPELEGYALKYTGSQNVVCYLPDFWIPEMQSYFEIKPALGNSLNESMPTPQECEKVIRLCIGTQKSVCILVGDVWPGAYRIIEYSPLSPEKIKRLMETIN